MTPNPLVGPLDRMLQSAEQAVGNEQVMAYEELSRHIGSLDDMARELFQRSFVNYYRDIAQKLDRGEQMTSEDIEAVRLLLVGDAKFYLKFENNYEDWRSELRRLMSELAALKQKETLSGTDMLQVQALCRDVRNVLPDLTNYLRERERVERFENTVKGGSLDSNTAQFLASMIREMISSSQM